MSKYSFFFRLCEILSCMCQRSVIKGFDPERWERPPHFIAIHYVIYKKSCLINNFDLVNTYLLHKYDTYGKDVFCSLSTAVVKRLKNDCMRAVSHNSGAQTSSFLTTKATLYFSGNIVPYVYPSISSTQFSALDW